MSIPIIAPMAAPPELGEELCLRVGFVGSGAAARIEAAEVRATEVVDPGLILGHWISVCFLEAVKVVAVLLLWWWTLSMAVSQQ